MASTFRRKAKLKPSPDSYEDASVGVSATSSNSMLGLSGTKAWTGGSSLTSSGLRDLDGILGGGQPLGTCILIEEDRWTQSLASALMRYWCAEAVSQNQHLMIPTSEEEEEAGAFGCLSINEGEEVCATFNNGPSKEEVLQFLKTLPYNLHWEKQQLREEGINESSGRVMMETLEEDPEEEEEEASNEEGLKIAWQYKKEIQQQRTGHDGSTAGATKSSDVFCHSYDLSRSLGSQLTQQQKLPLEDLVYHSAIHCPAAPTNRSSGFLLYQKLLDEVRSEFAKQGRKVVRLLLFHFDPQTLSVALPLLLVQIRLLQLPVVIMVGLRPWKSSSSTSSKSIVNLHRACDVVLQTEGFAARSVYPPPPEFRHLHGLLLIRRLSTHTAASAIGGGHFADLTISKRPPANIYGLKRDRRKLHIPLLHIPPEDHAGGGGSVGGGGVRSGAGRPASSNAAGGGCGSGGGNSLLEF